MHNNLISKKINRLFESKNLLKLKFFLHKLFKEKDIGNLQLDFKDKPSRIDIVQMIINSKNYKKYLEIGCFKNELFDNIVCNFKVGVDPVSGGTIRDTSDNYFELNKDVKFDCIFIDGLHKYDQVKRDILNSLDHLNQDGIIMLHDCLPNNVYDQAIPRCQYKWNGDVWKALVEMRTKPNLDVYTCYADQGIGVIFKRPNRNLLNYPKKDYSKLKFSEYFYNHKKLMNIIEYEELMKII